MADKTARAQVDPVRQRTQYTCMASSMAMCLQALGHECDEDEVNKVMGATPMRGAAWEQALATAQHYGCRATLTMPSTIRQLKEWTDAGIPVMIAWNPEGRDWSHASVVYHVEEGPIEALSESQTLQGGGPGLYVFVADPNIPNPDKVTRIVHEDDFYGAWYEKFPNYLVRRPACAIAREVTPGGRQVMASMKTAFTESDLMDLALDFKRAILADRSLRSGFRNIKMNTDGRAWTLYAEVPGWSRDLELEAGVRDFDTDSIARKHGLKRKGGSGGIYIAPDGQQVNMLFAGAAAGTKVAEETEMAGRKKKPQSRKDKMKTPDAPKRRNQVVKEMVERNWGSGKHHNRKRDVAKGRSRKPKHKKDYRRERYASASKVADRFLSACGMNGDCSCKCSIPDNKETSDV